MFLVRALAAFCCCSTAAWHYLRLVVSLQCVNRSHPSTLANTRNWCMHGGGGQDSGCFLWCSLYSRWYHPRPFGNPRCPLSSLLSVTIVAPPPPPAASHICALLPKKHASPTVSTSSRVPLPFHPRPLQASTRRQRETALFNLDNMFRNSQFAARHAAQADGAVANNQATDGNLNRTLLHTGRCWRRCMLPLLFGGRTLVLEVLEAWYACGSITRLLGLKRSIRSSQHTCNQISLPLRVSASLTRFTADCVTLQVNQTTTDTGDHGA
jgi:hypothetical protein